MGIWRECVRGQRLCSLSPAWDSAWTEGIGGCVDVCGWGRQRLRNVRNFSISQLFPILEWAMVASLRRTDQEMQREGEDRHWDKPGSSARLGNWRFNAKPPMVNCLKCVSPPSLRSDPSKKLSMISNLQISRAPFFPEDWLAFEYIYTSIYTHTYTYTYIYILLFGKRLLSSSQYFHFLLQDPRS